MDLTAAAPPKVIASDEASDEETWEMDGTAAAPPKVIAFGGISINESYLRAWTFLIINRSKWLPLLHSSTNSELFTHDHGGQPVKAVSQQREHRPLSRN